MPREMSMERDLLMEIAQCNEIRACLGENLDHPCYRIVHSQHLENITNFQLPEPWSGYIGSAPILFISSNPSISQEEIFPTWEWDNEDIADFFRNRFGGGKQLWIKDGTKSLRKDGGYGQWTRFWAGVKGRARELLEREPVPGVDYALTELVHCKSRQEEGVQEALDKCTNLYLDKVIEISGARILVGLGGLAREVLAIRYGLSSCKKVFGPLEIGGRKRLVTFLPHPNAWKDKTFLKVLGEEELSTLRQFL